MLPLHSREPSFVDQSHATSCREKALQEAIDAHGGPGLGKFSNRREPDGVPGSHRGSEGGENWRDQVYVQANVEQKLFPLFFL